ncbi:hypothetical protein Q5P01_005301 [Channa striata]|uniref:Uncharacterized protein n=1 Tax=Channa striata TaxID=64152 RepID=A0AA88NFZ0_CHASR|nr:hypothetical protein Q5P01_005301 [Channa striata]
MSLPKAVGCTLVLCVILYSLEKQGYRQTLNGFFEELMSTKASNIPAKEKRAIASNSTEYIFDAVANLSNMDLLNLRAILNTLSYPIAIDSSLEVTSINLTTVCSQNVTGYQCRCEANFVWPYSSCITNGACDAIVDNTCGCIYSLPTNNQYCQPEPVDIDLVLELRFPISASSYYFAAQLRNMLQNSHFFPYVIDQYVKVTDVNITTECNSLIGDMHCQCEQQFAWSCNKCKKYGACSNNTTQNCGCQDSLPYDGEFCGPITGVTICPAPTPVDTDLVLELMFPESSSSNSIFGQVLGVVQRPDFLPYTIDQYVKVTDINITTECYSYFGVLQCYCYWQYAWSCDKCKKYGACSKNDTTPNCGCQDTLPYDGQFCEPITAGVTICPAPAPVDIDLVLEVVVTTVNITTECYSNSTGGPQCQCEQQFAWSCNKCKKYGACSNDNATQNCGCQNPLPYDGQFCEPITGVTICPAPTPVPVDFDLVLELRFTNSASLNTIVAQLRNMLQNPYSLPYSLDQYVRVTGINITTDCYLNSTGDSLCQCEQQFAWSCNKCIKYSACSNGTTPNCGCQDLLPYDGEFCGPITGVTICPAPTPVPVDFDLVLELRFTNSASLNTIVAQLRNMLQNPYSLPYSLDQYVRVTGINITTDCYLNSTGDSLCQCEQQYAWSCNKCKKYGACSNGTTPNCGCLNPLPYDGQFCEPITYAHPLSNCISNVSIDPTPSPQVKNASFTMNLDFNSSFNDPHNTVYQDINGAIKTQCAKYITTLKSANLVAFRSGSTIADYMMTATSFQDSELQAAKSGIFVQLAGKYPIIFDALDPLTFAPPTVFYGKMLAVICAPPADIAFGTSWTAEWKHNNALIPEDVRYSYSMQSGTAVLTISNVLISDSGNYDCNLQRPDKSSFHQTSVRAFTVGETPVIQVFPANIEVKCGTGKTIMLQCSVNSPYKVQFVNFPDAGTGDTITYPYKVPSCDSTTQDTGLVCQVANMSSDTQVKTQIGLKISNGQFLCDSNIYGVGNEGQSALAPCPPGQVGQVAAICTTSGWQNQSDSCILKVIYDLLVQSQFITITTLPTFLQQLKNVTTTYVSQVVGSPANVNATVQILNNVANRTTSLFIPITNNSMQDVLITAGILTTAKTSWQTLNAIVPQKSPEKQRVSSEFLQSLEFITGRLTNNSFDLSTDYILLNKTTFRNTFSATFNSSVDIAIPEASGVNQSITVITFALMDNVLPPRDKVNSTSNVVNGRVVLVQSNGAVNNISFTFDVINNNLGNPQCVFWNFNLFSGLGGWDNTGCQAVFSGDKIVTCNCSHLTSFSILMSPYSPKDPVLDYITYIGVGISMASLVICLIIEAIIWRKINKNNTSYLRHVSIVNIAVSLLIADIWFIIGAAISAAESENKPACSTAAFFIHYFYLALFFWMLASALLLLYRTVNVFEGGLSKVSMLVIGFVVGYGVPFIIAIITIAVTAPKQQYLQAAKICWLNWNDSKALLAFVIPALTIVLIDLIILIVVIYKILRRRVVRDTAHAEERNAMMVIARTLAVLTPFFGITWSLGVGTMVAPYNRGMNIAFAFFNSLQGFFILVFGTLLDKKVRSELAAISQTSSSGTRTTSAGTSSSGLGFFRNWIRGRDGYNVTSGASGASQSYVNSS